MSGASSEVSALKKELIINDPATAWRINGFIDSQEQTLLWDTVMATKGTLLKERSVYVFGKWHVQPRLVGLCAATPLRYTYSGQTLTAGVWPQCVADLCARVNEVTGTSFNACLVNYYRDGADSIGWHADDERDLGEDGVVAAVSLGETRPMLFKRVEGDLKMRWRVPLAAGQLLVMGRGFQEHFQHHIPPTKRKIRPRLSLTFRKLAS